MPDRVPEELFENMLGKMSEKISEDMPGTADRMQKTKLSENMDNRMPEGMSEDVLDRMQKK